MDTRPDGRPSSPFHAMVSMQAGRPLRRTAARPSFIATVGKPTLAIVMGVQVALDVVLFIMSVMGGRVIPMFTNNGVPGAGARRDERVEKAALGSVLALLVADVLGLQGIALAALALFAAVAHGTRWALWKPWKTRHVPIVWVLHIAYAWIPLHLALRAAAPMGWVANSAATHALTAGAIGGLIIGMMTLTARGHTGRPLHADGFDITCYTMVSLGAVLRVPLPLLMPQWTVLFVVASASLWSAAFGLYAVRYWPVLTRARPDGKPG